MVYSFKGSLTHYVTLLWVRGLLDLLQRNTEKIEGDGDLHSTVT